MRILSTTAVNAINWYQADISPKKGFCCAYRVRHGGPSCSVAVKQTFLSKGFLLGVYSVFTQAAKCYSAAVSLAEQENKPSTEDNENEKLYAAWAATEGASWCCFLPFIS